MAKYEQYDEYKDSDVGWLKQVPKHWKKITFKYLLEMMVDNRGRTPPTYDVGIPLLEAKQIDGSLKYTGTSFDKFINEAGHSGFIRDDVKENDILFITVGTIGKTCLVPNQPDFVIAQNLVALRMIDNYSPVFMLFWLRSMAARESMLATNKDSILDSIKISDFIQSRLYIPELYEQTQIANFLDHETAQIDTLIEKQQTLIQLLKEKRQAVISHAVTKGLNPDAPMKDSGVEWLGEVPGGWKVATVRRYLLEHRQGYYTSDSYVDDGTKLLRITDLRDLGKIDTNDSPKVPKSASLNNYLLKEGDVVFARTGGAGSFGVIPEVKEDIAYASYLIRFRFLPKFFNTNYLRFMFIADSFQLAVKQNIHGGVNQNIHAEDIKNTFVASPPLDEQEKISTYLDIQTNSYAKLIANAEQAIQLMQERRTALISAAVTGKIDVRGWVAPESKTTLESL